MSIKFSIGIPAYKAMFLDECITSIINQTYTNFELIIVNDASP
ncbi:TPA: glycosyltransferase, partial [Klebsiella pneumoniae]